MRNERIVVTLDDRDELACALMAEVERRAGIWRWQDPLLRDAACQAMYCLDAPDLIPAGGVYWEWVAEVLGGVSVAYVERIE